MAFSSSSFSAMTCIGFVIILLLSFDIVVRAARPAAEVDPMLDACTRTTYPQTCTECITPVKDRPAKFDLKTMVGEILFCTWSHATYAFNDAEDLAKSCITNGCINKDVVLECNSTIFNAKEQIFASWNNIQSEDLSKIQTDLVDARTKLNDCAYQQFAGQFTQKLIDEMDTTKRLQEIGTSLCQQGPTPTVSVRT